MSEWKEYKLGDLIDYKKGFAFQSSTYQNSGIPVVRVSDTTDNSIDISSCHKVNDEIAERCKDYRLFENDIIIATVGSWADNPNSIVGKVIRVPKSAHNALLNQNAVRLRSNGYVSSDMLYYKLKDKGFSDYLLNTAQGSANQASITLKDIFSYDILLPSIEEQERIAGILSSLDDKIDLLTRQNRTLEAMAETLFRQYFIENPKEDWKDGYLGDILTVKGGTTPSTSNPNFWDGDIAWTSPRDITTLNGIYFFETERKITQKGLLQIGSGLLAKGTLLMSSRAPVGVLAFTEIPLAINQGYIAMLDNRGFSKEFIYLWLKANMDLVHSYSNGSTFMEISKSAFKSLEISLPPICLLTDFQELILPLFDKIKVNAIQIRSLTKLRDTLLPKLMNNEIKL